MSTSETARAAILGRIGRALGVGDEDRDSREKAVKAWRENRAKGRGAPRPERAAKPQPQRLAQFVAESTRNGSTVIEIDDLAALPATVADYLRGRNAGGPLRVAPHPDLEALDWGGAEIGEWRTGPATQDDAVSVSVAVAAAAETGSLAFVAGPETPATLHVLPMHHVSVIYASRIDGGYEDAVARARVANDGMPRILNVITGPSRTADIEQTLLMGAHGPQAEVVVVVKDR
ncbi:MAG: lactate utilization protein [Rhodospirillales bacterium]